MTDEALTRMKSLKVLHETNSVLGLGLDYQPHNVLGLGNKCQVVGLGFGF